MAGVQQNKPAEYFNDIVLLSQRLLRPGISIEESQTMYNKWASLGTYDEVRTHRQGCLPNSLGSMKL